MKLTEGKIREAQKVLQELAKILGYEITIYPDESPVISTAGGACYEVDDLAADYVDALHERAGTEPPPF